MIEGQEKRQAEPTGEARAGALLEAEKSGGGDRQEGGDGRVPEVVVEQSVDDQVVEQNPGAVKKLEAPQEDIKNLYATVYAFNLFTITDGAIRVIVLLHANNLGFSPIQIALMFSLYELAGVITNLFGGIAATHFGLKVTLFISVVLQIIGLVLLMLVDPIFGSTEDAENLQDKFTLITAYITLCQMMSGIAKDFMKISCKTVPKFVSKPGDDDGLFKIVAFVTGLKNSFKGFGHILGAVLVQFAGFEIGISVLLAVVLLIIPVPAVWLSPTIGKGSEKAARVFSFDVFKKSKNVNVLSFARFFLFGSRDVWFEIAAPIFLRGVLDWPELTIGLFMGGYIIMYGYFQTSTSKLYKDRRKQVTKAPSSEPSQPGSVEMEKQGRCASFFQGSPDEKHVPFWANTNAIFLAIWGSVLYVLFKNYVDNLDDDVWNAALGGTLVGGLVIFAFIFAVNSAVHSYLIVLYSDKDKAAMDLGFYYMANAMGRLVGTILSGVIFQFTRDDFGLSICLWTAAAFMFMAAFVGRFLGPNEQASISKV
mmetsp:Transcript_17284/g.30464  ORF Transcript_17284/g.30464 Transcript_17284/m.30464 type:complete len:536 (+) Transcript_17284:142-1749(+)|eukprot:CAMPEP_0184561052 /NCGR_PEP_ID=MMETSP0199_2-20130426/47246_1 /TAXON_ID=1112570 /ORGANISM="Thraustochytrium sp., Strain LLF1b" /LENGTH=535 /DNA_ID=CAMNT_0026958363 /DNA_START=70 /DNA_END=1677 /DNA_ORIENTATION=+